MHPFRRCNNLLLLVLSTRSQHGYSKFHVQNLRRYLLIVVLPLTSLVRGTQREYSSKPLKLSIDERILVFKQ